MKTIKNLEKKFNRSVIAGLEELKTTEVLGELRHFCEKTIKEQSKEAFDAQKVLEKARWHISFRIDDVLAMENYVHLQNEALKHHEMRIRAKKLRYTMESFSPLYKNKLLQEIENNQNTYKMFWAKCTTATSGRNTSPNS